jgi:hypothetical protein
VGAEMDAVAVVQWLFYVRLNSWNFCANAVGITRSGTDHLIYLA